MARRRPEPVQLKRSWHVSRMEWRHSIRLSGVVRLDCTTVPCTATRLPAARGKLGAMSSPAQDPAELSYEQARDELVQVVSRLEQGGSTLEESLQLWERGEALAARCEEWLLGARQRLEAARQGSGSVSEVAE